MFCKKCGSPIGQKDKFCKTCEAAETAEKAFIKRTIWKSVAISVLTVTLGVGGVAVGLFFLPYYFNLETVFEHSAQNGLAAAPVVFVTEESPASADEYTEYIPVYEAEDENNGDTDDNGLYLLDYADDEDDESDIPAPAEADDEEPVEDEPNEQDDTEEIDEDEIVEDDADEEDDEEEAHPFEQIIRITSPGAFVLEHSSQRALTESDLEGLTPLELRIARNEIYARHGRIFVDDVLRSHFNEMPWYVPVIPPRAGVPLSELERANVDFIRDFEGAER